MIVKTILQVIWTSYVLHRNYWKLEHYTNYLVWNLMNKSHPDIGLNKIKNLQKITVLKRSDLAL